MSCKKINTKKYKSRKGPPFHAKDCKGVVKLGNDGLSYISSSDKNGVYKWMKRPKANKTVKIKGKGLRSYFIHSHGFMPPFIATVSPSTKHIEVIETESSKEILTTKYSTLYLGENLLNDPLYAKKGKGSLGNSILVKVSKHKYIYIGSEIYSFETDEDIKSYYSPIGNGDFPYPYAIGSKLTYFMLDKQTVPTELLNSKKDGYGQFYGHIVTDESTNEQIEKEKRSFKVKMIHRKKM